MILLLPFLLLSSFRSTAQTDANGPVHEAIITLHIQDMDEPQWQHLNARVAHDHSANIEYGCLRAGIVVLRLQELNLAEKADVITVVKRMLDEAGIKGNTEFLDIHLEERSAGKC